MIDLGTVHGQRVFYTGGRSYRELIEAGEILAIPDPQTGIVFKRTVNCSEVEKAAAFSVDEAERFISEWNARLSND